MSSRVLPARSPLLVSRVRRIAWLSSPWVAGALLGAAHYVGVVNLALNGPLQRFDEGVRLSATTLLAHGQLPVLDFYTPYGWAYGVPGLPARWIFGDQAIAHHMVYALAPALLVCLVFVWAARRRGWLIGLAAALLAFPADAHRYALAWCALAGFLLVIDRAIRSSSGRTLHSAIAERPHQVALGGVLLATMGWFKVEYGAFAVLWGLFLAGDARTAAAWTRTAVPMLVAVLAPYALVVALGGGQHLVTYGSYLLFDVGDERGRPVVWSEFAQWFRGPGLLNAPTVVLWLSYAVGAAVIAIWAGLLALRALGRPLPEDRTRLAPFLGLLCVLLLYVQVRTYSTGQGAATVPVYWLALLALPGWRRGMGIAAACGAALVLLLPPVYKLWPVTAYHTMKDGLALSHRDEAIPKLKRIPLVGDTGSALRSIHALWAERVSDRDRLFTLNRRSDQATGNEAFLYWFLDARAAAWPVVFDPGLADDEGVQHDVVDALCEHSVPIVQHDVAYPLLTRGPAEHGSRYLDQFVALNYRLEAASDLFRILLRWGERCLRPERAPEAVVTDRRDALLRADDLPAAGALSTLLMERARAANRPVAPEDVAGAVLGGYWVSDAELPEGRVRTALRALRDGTLSPDLATAAQAPGPPLVRLAAQTAYVQLRQNPQDPAGPAVAPALRRLVEDAPEWPAAQRNMFSYQPPSDPLYRHLRSLGGESPDLERWRFGLAQARGDRRAAELTARRLLHLLSDRPLDRARFLADLAAFYTATGDSACANRALEVADRVPGFDAPPHGDSAACRSGARL